MSEMNAKKICKIMDMAKSVGAPVIGLNALAEPYSEGVIPVRLRPDFLQKLLCSGIIPQISVIMGPCAGGASYSPALTDFVIMVDRISQMFITGPAVVESTTGEVISAEELGGAYTHASTSGVAHLVAESEDEALEFARKILSYLPSSADELPPSGICSR